MIKPTVAILLTMWRSPARESMYTSRIHWWSTQVRPPDSLFLVDSYGSLRNSSKVLSFNQDVHFLKKKSSSTYELFALKAALDRLPDLLRHTYVFKVTCKYVVPHLLVWLHTFRPVSSLVIQNFGDANTEVLGFRSDNMTTIVAELTQLNTIKCCFEGALLQIKHSYTTTKMPPFEVPPHFRIKRGFGDILPFLR